jgi:hypothetical protein
MTLMLLLLVLASLVQAPQLQPRTLTPETGTAVIRGRVTDKESGRPLARATVAIWLASRRIENLTDEDGRYEFTNLPAGGFSVSATAGEHSATHAMTGFETRDERGRRVTRLLLKDGEVRERVDIALPRALAINGRVLDDRGDPLARVSIRVQNAGRGGRHGGYPRKTDDRGQFRVFGLPAGTYTVCADIDTSSVRASLGTASTPRLIPTCYPSASEQDAERIEIASSDAEGVEIRMRRVATFTISGVVVGEAGGTFEGGSLTLTQYNGNGSSTTPMPLDAGGSFSIPNLIPGEYFLRASMVPSGMFSSASRGAARAELPVRIDTADVTGLVLAMKMPAQVSGRIAFDGVANPTAERLRMFVAAQRKDDRHGERQPPSLVTPDLTFELIDLMGPMTVSVNGLPRGWIVREVRYRGRDITDVPTEFRTGDDAIEIALTNRGAVVRGRVTDASGNPTTYGRVIIFPADAARRRHPPGHMAGAVSKNGRFSLQPRRAGDYLIVAVPDTQDRQFQDLKYFDVLARYAERIVLLEGDLREIDLRMTDIPRDQK